MIYTLVYLGMIFSSYDWYSNRLPDDPVKAKQYLKCEEIMYNSIRKQCFKNHRLKP